MVILYEARAVLLRLPRASVIRTKQPSICDAEVFDTSSIPLHSWGMGTRVSYANAFGTGWEFQCLRIETRVIENSPF
jgi:hypothetical protein